METQPVAIIMAASSGIGAACARELAQRQYQVVVMSRSEKIKEVADELNGTAYQGDVTNPEDLKGLVDLAINRYGRIDAVVTNTGHVPKGDLLEISDEDWNKAFNMMLMNVIHVSRLVTPIMEKQGQGAIVNISAFAAVEPTLRYPTSSVIRAALSNYAKLYSTQYAASNIRMNTVLPGFIENYAIDEETRNEIAARRSGKLDEVAKTVAFLLSEDAGYITGQNIRVDGGLTISI